MGPQKHSVGETLKFHYGLNTKTMTAGAGTDAQDHVSAVIDRKNAAGSLAGSAMLGFLMTTTIAASKTLTTPILIDTSPDTSNWEGYVTLDASETLVTGLTTTEADVYTYNVDLSKYERYIRFKLTPDLSATGTDVADLTLTVITGGYDKTPVS